MISSKKMVTSPWQVHGEDPHVNVWTFCHLLSWMNHQVQGGAPQTLCLLVYKPHEYYHL